MPSSAVKKSAPKRLELDGSPELLQVSRQLAQLAVAQHENPLSPRQREELRRALATAGEELRWSETRASGDDPVAEVTPDVTALTENGFELLEQDLVEERARKQTEVARLTDVARSTRELAENPNAAYPAEITYSYTVRDPFHRLITKTATSKVSDPREALGAAVSLDKSMEGRTKLTDLMVIDLEERRGRLRAMRRTVPEFVESSRELLAEVIANLS
jgi:hypothetical protein